MKLDQERLASVTFENLSPERARVAEACVARQFQLNPWPFPRCLDGVVADNSPVTHACLE